MKQRRNQKTTVIRSHRSGDKRGVFGLLYIYLVVFFIFSFTTVLLTRGSNDLRIAERALGINQQFWGAEGSLDQAVMTLQTTTPPKLAAGACADPVMTAYGSYLLCGTSAAAGSDSGNDSSFSSGTSLGGGGGSGTTLGFGGGGASGMSSNGGLTAPTLAKVCEPGAPCDTGTSEGDGQATYALTAKGNGVDPSNVTTSLSIFPPQPSPDVIRTVGNDNPTHGGGDGYIDLDHSDVPDSSSIRSGRIPTDPTDVTVNLRMSHVGGDVFTFNPQNVVIGKNSAVDGEIITLNGDPTIYEPKEVPPDAQLLNLSGQVNLELERTKHYVADAKTINMKASSILTVADGKPGSAILHIFGSTQATAVFSGDIGDSPDGDKKKHKSTKTVHLVIVDHRESGEIQVNEGVMRAGIEARHSNVFFRSTDFKGWAVARAVTGTTSTLTRNTLGDGDDSLPNTLKPVVDSNGWRNGTTVTATTPTPPGNTDSTSGGPSKKK